MTIVMIGQKGLPARSGGIERHVSLLASGLVTRGHRVVVYGRRWYVGNGKVPAGVEQRFTVGLRTKHLDAITHGFTALLDARRVRPDVIHIHGAGMALLTPLARVLHPRAKTVVTIHCKDHVLSKWNVLAKTMFRLGEWLACHLSHRAITISQDLAKYCLDAYRIQTTYVTHAFPLMEVLPNEKFLETLELRKEGYLLFVGRLIPDKRAHSLIQAYADARKAYPELFAQVPLVLVGGGSWTDQYVKWLTQLAASVPGVQMLGERTGEELRALQAYALGHVFPTASEGLAFSMVEAGAYARPMLVTDLPQNREATGGHAIEVKLGDQADLSRGLVELVSTPSQARAILGKRAQEHVASTFHYGDRIDDVARVYHSLVHGSDALTTPVSVLEFALKT